MRGLGAVVAKDLRLLLRDRAGLVFLALAPIVGITVAGLSLSTLYGADPTGQTAYTLPGGDEDGSGEAREATPKPGAERARQVQPVAARTPARAEVRDRKRSGAALIIPPGTGAALREGRSAELLLYTDPVKYLERMHVQLALARVRDSLVDEWGERARSDAKARIA